MRIGIDCRLWNETGVGRYIRNLVSNLSKIDKKNEYVLFAKTQDEKTIRSVVSGQLSVVHADMSWHGITEQIRLPKILNEQNLDLMHFPYFSVPIFYSKPFIVTIHDLIVNRFNTGRASTLPLPLYFAKRAGYHAVLSNAIYRAKKIIVPSNAVRDDLLKTYLNISSSKVEVTYEGGFSQKPKANSQQPIVEGRYLLRVGNFYPHKNVDSLLLAFKDFLYDNYENHDVKLVLVGKKDFFFKRIEKQIEELNVGANVIFLENAKDSELFSLYSNAVATIIPSFSEGFSLTAVEALGCGSPVVVSDIPVHREICSNAAIYCNPNDINDIRQKINFACSLIEESRNELIAQGKKQARKFSWEKMAEQTLAIYTSSKML
ncbi:MAG: glycosyltransferase family 4 protein [Candidatus Levybacteria bacterium]|nr:glycosyltransferase family 4 protein [Candidatus Levybacteria bacterium]